MPCPVLKYRMWYRCLPMPDTGKRDPLLLSHHASAVFGRVMPCRMVPTRVLCDVRDQNAVCDVRC
eukprot:2461482-Rhodomonas_salina.9